MATYSDSFTNTAGTVLHTHNVLWVFVAGDGAAYYGIAAGTGAGTLFTGTSVRNIFRYDVSVGADQFSEFVVENTGAQFDGNIKALIVLRSSTDASPNHDNYFLEVQDNGANGASHNFLVFKTVNGTMSQVGTTFTANLSNGDTVRFEATGTTTTTLVTKLNGTQIDSRTDSSSPHTSGQIGIGGARPSGMRMASWSGGDLSAPAADLAATPAAAATSTAGLSTGIQLAVAAAAVATATAGLAVASGGTITSSALKNNTGALQTSAPLEAYVNHVSTGALIAKLTGITSHATTAVASATDVALTVATTYAVRWRRTDTGAEGYERITAT